MNEEKTRKCLRQVEHIRGHLWHIYSIAVNQVMVTTVELSKWWLQINQEERTKLTTVFLTFSSSKTDKPSLITYRWKWLNTESLSIWDIHCIYLKITENKSKTKFNYTKFKRRQKFNKTKHKQRQKIINHNM